MVDVMRPYSQPADIAELLAAAPLDPEDATNSTANLGSCHVDYFSHTWDESDLQKSWRFTTKHKDNLFNGRRLENASWRRWFQDKFHLRKLDPAELNWFKDSDICWLYGPIFYAAPVNDRRPGGTTTSTGNTGILTTASAVDLVQRQSTPGANDPARPLQKSDSLERLNLIDGGHHHPPLKSALKKREADDIVSVIRRERELLHSMADQEFKMGKRSTSPRRQNSVGPGAQRNAGSMARSKSTSDLSSMKFGPGALGGNSGRMYMGTPVVESQEPKWPPRAPAPSADSGSTLQAAPKPVSSRVNLADMLAEAAKQMEPPALSPGNMAQGPSDSELSGDESGMQASDKMLRFNRKVEQRIIFDLYNEEDPNASDEEYDDDEDEELVDAFAHTNNGHQYQAGRRRGSVNPRKAKPTILAAGTVDLKVDSEEDAGPMVVDADQFVGLVPGGSNFIPSGRAPPPVPVPSQSESEMADDDEEDDEDSEDEGMFFGAKKPAPGPSVKAPVATTQQQQASNQDPLRREGSPGIIGSAVNVASYVGNVIKNNLGL